MAPHLKGSAVLEGVKYGLMVPMWTGLVSVLGWVDIGPLKMLCVWRCVFSSTFMMGGVRFDERNGEMRWSWQEGIRYTAGRGCLQPFMVPTSTACTMFLSDTILSI